MHNSTPCHCSTPWLKVLWAVWINHITITMFFKISIHVHKPKFVFSALLKMSLSTQACWPSSDHCLNGPGKGNKHWNWYISVIFHLNNFVYLTFQPNSKLGIVEGFLLDYFSGPKLICYYYFYFVVIICTYSSSQDHVLHFCVGWTWRAFSKIAEP